MRPLLLPLPAAAFLCLAGPARTLLVRADGGLDLDWPAVRAKRYHLETSPDLVIWTRIKTVTGAEGPHGESVPAAGLHLFARVRAEDLDSGGDGLSDWDNAP